MLDTDKIELSSYLCATVTLVQLCPSAAKPCPLIHHDVYGNGAKKLYVRYTLCIFCLNEEQQPEDRQFIDMNLPGNGGCHDPSEASEVIQNE
jgi:hypothetical protein